MTETRIIGCLALLMIAFIASFSAILSSTMKAEAESAEKDYEFTFKGLNFKFKEGTLTVTVPGKPVSARVIKRSLSGGIHTNVSIRYETEASQVTVCKWVRGFVEKIETLPQSP